MMPSFKSYLLPALIFSAFIVRSAGETITLLEEPFADESALGDWTLYSNNDGRIQLIADPGDPNDLQLMLDDGRDDIVASKNVVKREIAIPSLQSLKLAFDFISHNDEVQGTSLAASSIDDDSEFDGVVIRLADGSSERFNRNQIVDGFNEFNISARFTLEQLSSSPTLTIELHQFDNFASPNDGLAWDNLELTGTTRQDILVEPPSRLSESDTTFSIPVIYSPSSNSERLVSLFIQGTSEPHGFAVFPRDTSLATLTFPGFDDDVIDGTQSVTAYLADGVSTSQMFTIQVEDDEVAGLSMRLPSQVREFEGAQVATISLIGPLTRNVRVFLNSSHPDLVSVPEYVNVYSYYSEYTSTFNIIPVIDPRLVGDEVVTISATLGGESVAQTIRFEEGNSLAPVVSGPAQIREGEQGVSFVVGLNAITEEPIDVSLSISNPELILSASTVTIAPGSSQVAVQISFTDDSEDLGDRDAILTASVAGGETTTFVMQAIDNDISGFRVTLPEVVEIGVNQWITVLGVNRDGSQVTTFTGTVDVVLVNTKDASEITLLDNVLVDHGRFFGALSVPTDVRSGTIRIRSDNGLSSDYGPLVFYRSILFPASDIIYDDIRDRLYTVSAGDAIAGHIHSLTAINPNDATIGDRLFLGSEPTTMAITENGQYLYVGLMNPDSVARIDINSFSKIGAVNLGNSAYSSQSRGPEQILPLPGRPLDFVVSQRFDSYPYQNVNAYFNGAIQTKGSSYESWSLALGGTPGIFYGFNRSSSYFDLSRIQITADGFETVESKGELIVGYRTSIASENDIIFGSDGNVIDGLDLKRIGKIDLPWQLGYYSVSTVMTDLARSRVFYTLGNELAVFDSQSFQLLEHLSFSNIGNFKKLIRYGESGLAATTDQGRIVFIDSARLRPSGEPTDLAVTVSQNLEVAVIGQPVTYSYQVTNTSSVVAEGVILSLNLGEGQGFEASTFSNTQVSGNVVKHFIGDLSPGAIVSIITSSIPSRLTTLSVTAAATTISLDADYRNNLASALLNVSFQSSPNSVEALDLPITDVRVNPIDGNLVVLTRADAKSGVASQLLVMSPTSGQILKAIRLPSAGVKLALAENGLVAYALSAESDSAYRIDLVAGLHTMTVTFGGVAKAFDIEVLRGTTDSIIIGIGNGYYGESAIKIYDNGVQRAVGVGVYYDRHEIVLLPDPSLVFAHAGNAASKYQIRPSGIDMLSTKYDILGYNYYEAVFKSSGYLIFGPNGVVVRGDTLTNAGNYDLSNLPGSMYSNRTVVEPDMDLQRVYYARGNSITSFDSDSRLRIRSKTFSDLPSGFSSLERWSSDGFVARLEDGTMAIIRTDLIPTAPGAVDLIVDLQDGMNVDEPSLTIFGQAYAGQGIASVSVNGEFLPPYYAFASWTTTLDLNEGNNTIRIVATEAGSGATVTKTYTVRYQNPEMERTIAEIAREMLQVADLPVGWESADEDQDGYSARVEILFGMNPAVSDEMRVLADSWQGGSEVLCYRRLRAHAARYCVAVSEGLGLWDQTESLVNIVGDPTIVAEDNRYEDVCFTVDAGNKERLFLKVMVE